jgi:threonine dehydratase
MMRALTGVQVDHTEAVNTIADGIAVRVPVPEAIDDLRGLADDFVAVEDGAILSAMRGLVAHTGLVIEPAGAVGIAALLSAAHGTYGERVGTILCGGNVTTAQMEQWNLLRAAVG